MAAHQPVQMLFCVKNCSKILGRKNYPKVQKVENIIILENKLLLLYRLFLLRYRYALARLQKIYPQRVAALGHDTHSEWPPKLPDLSPHDHFLWGYIKNTPQWILPISGIELRKTWGIFLGGVSFGMQWQRCRIGHKFIPVCVEIKFRAMLQDRSTWLTWQW